jgi:hypothetical protein
VENESDESDAELEPGELSDDGKRRIPLESFDDVELGPLQIGPDGGIAGPIGVPPAVEAATPEHFICLRGPCRHYWAFETFMASGNPKETWDPETGLKDLDGNPIRPPRQVSRSCTAQPGIEIELTDDCVYECNRWSPISPRELKRENRRREKYYRQNPSHRPK